MARNVSRMLGGNQGTSYQERHQEHLAGLATQAQFGRALLESTHGLSDNECMEHPVDKGTKTEAIILAELVKRDYRVLTPFGVNHRYDLVIELDDEFVRVQCKTGRLRNGTVVFEACSVQGGNTTAHSTRKLYHGAADVFVVFCPEIDKLYWVPVDQVGVNPRLRIDPPKNGQIQGIRWAKDYELADVAQLAE